MSPHSPANGFRLLFILLWIGLLAQPASAQRQMEKLGRGVIATRTGTSSAYISWRLLSTDPDNVGFNLFRSTNGVSTNQLNSALITNTTDYVDTSVNFSFTNSWFVQPVVGTVTQALSASWTLITNAPTRQYFSVPLHDVGGASPPYDVKFCWVGDLDGDGEYDFVMDRLTATGTNALNQYLQAYKRDGTFLWQMDMGYNSTNQYNIEPGSSAISVGDKDNVTVYDLDGDGYAEVAVRTAAGVVFPDGSTITDTNNTTQYLSILNGLTGKELARVTLTNLWPSDGPMSFRMGVMYCDGVHPSLIMEGENRNSSDVFQRESMAFDYRNGQLMRRWFTTTNSAWSHQIRISDVNHDGIDELLEIGSAHTGAGDLLFDTELLHGDRFHVMDIDPDHPGLETFAIQQNNGSLLATALYESGTGKMLKKWYMGAVGDVSRGVALDMDPNYRGCEFYSTQPNIYDCKGNVIFTNTIWPPEGIWWDADLCREFEDGPNSGATSPVINKYSPSTHSAGRLYSIYSEGVHQAYGGRAAFWGDIFGDWREELVLVANDYSEIRIYTTKLAATNRLYCLMQNPQYRDQATCKGYYQASYVDYYLGDGMQPPAPPPVSNARLVWRGDGTNNVWNTATTANWFTNWFYAGNANTNPAPFNAGDTVLFDLTGSNNTAVALSGSLAPGDVRVHSPKDYIFGGSGALTGTMGLTKAGAGKLIFNGTNTYTGVTLIAEGPFVVNGALPNSPVTVRGGVWLDGRLGGTGVVGSAVAINEGAGVSPGAGTNAAGTLTLAASLSLNGRTLNDFDLSSDPTGATNASDWLVVKGNLVLSGTNTFVIHLLNANLATNGVYPLITYAGTLTGGLTNLAVSGLSGIPFALTNPAGQIALLIKGCRPPATVAWTGDGSGNRWDLLTTANWLNGAAKDMFAPNDIVRFDNTGASNLTVNLVGDLNATNVIVDSASNYVFAGSGALIGTCSLTKTNSGTLTLGNVNNTYTGKTTVAGGTLAVAELDAIGFASPIGNPPGGTTNLILSGGATLRLLGESYTDRGLTLNAGTNTIEMANASDQLTMAGLMVGSGSLQILGPGTVALTSSNGYTGTTIIKNGTVTLGGDSANQYGFGAGGTGSVILDGGTLTMYDDVDTYNSTYWTLVVPTNTTGTLNTDERCYLRGTLTGGGTFNYNVSYVRTELDGNWSAFNGQINVTGSGDFRINNSYGYANAALYLSSGIYAYHITSSTAVSIGALSGAAGSCLSGGAWTVGAKNTGSTFCGNITATSLTKTGTGTLTLAGTNSYAGVTTVSAGTLLVNGDSSAAAGAVTVASAATLGGYGIIGGATTVNGRLSPGSNSIGTLTFTNNLTLGSAGAAVMKLNKASATNDLVAVSKTLTYAGTLVVSNLSGVIVAGDTFKIFNAATYSGAFSSFSLPVLANAVWGTTNLAINGTLAVVAGTNGPSPVTWKGDGINNLWDVYVTANWLDTNSLSALFTNGLAVTFDDTGSNNIPVLLAGSLRPGQLTVNASQDYIFTGPGSLDGTNALVKSGSGTLTLAESNSYSGGTVVNAGTIRLTPASGLAHRWSFNGSLADAAGTHTAALVDVGSSNATLGAASVTLAGGSRTVADYVSLGANLLPNSTNPVTIEIWATQNAVQNWARIFDFGVSSSEYLFMSWSQGTTVTNDRIEWKDTVTSTSDGTCQPYTVGTEFHIAMVIQPGLGTNGTTRVTWYRAAATNSSLGAACGTFDSTNTLAGFVNTNCWLGRSEYTGDYTASASYDEVRIWTRALSAAELQLLHTSGPDAVPAGSLPPGTALTLAGTGAVFDNQAGQPQILGSLSGVTGSAARLTTAGLTVGSDNTSTVFAGNLSGTNGLVKTGAGALTLSGANTLTGATVLSNGTLLVDGTLSGPVTAWNGTLGGNGSCAGAVAVMTNAILAPGDGGIGRLTVSNNLMLAGGCTNLFEITKSPGTNDSVRVTGTLNYGGVLVVTNLAGTLAAGDTFKLFDAAGYSGAFTAVTLPAPGTGLAWNRTSLAAAGVISVVSNTPPAIGSVVVSNAVLVLGGSNGVPGNNYYVLATTNLALPASAWTVLQTNAYDAAGGFRFTNAVPAGQSQLFYRLQSW
jgi:autotransporter-associated beta strand protein